MSLSDKTSLGIWFAFTGVEDISRPTVIAHGHGPLVEKIYRDVPNGSITFDEWQTLAKEAAKITAAYIDEQLALRQYNESK